MSENLEQIRAYVKIRNNALINLDMEWARLNMPDTTDEIRVIAMHKARYEVTTIGDELRHESRKWLQSHGYGRMFGEFLNDSELPK